MSQEGLEPPAYRFEVCHSVQLSYWPRVASQKKYIRKGAVCQIGGSRMNQQEAYQESRQSHPGSRSLRCIWYCGIINGKIKAAARLGETKLRLDYPPKHYVVAHKELFMKLYADQGYRVQFEPDYRYIQPSKWTFTLSWDQKEPLSGDGVISVT